jgi:hypothetical protein
MRLDGLRGWARGRDPWVRAAAAAWLVVVIAICVRCAVQPRVRTLYTTWAGAGHDWRVGRDLYRTTWEEHQDQFRYSPLAAVMLVPFSHLPERAGGVVWRLVNAGVLLAGFGGWLRAALPRVPSPRERAVLFLLLLPLALGSLNNGQPNPLVIGLLLAAVAAVARERWNSAALFVALATALKVYPLAVGLLLAAVFPRRFAPRLALALLAGLALPLACQRWDYVTGQYAQWFHRLGDNDRKAWPPHMAYRDLWLLLRVARVPLFPRAYTALQLAAAAGSALLCVAAAWRGLGRRQVLLVVLALGSCWMTLVGPATESCTYVLLAPVLAWAVLTATGRPWRAWGVSAGAGPPWPAGVRWLPAAAWWVFLATVLAGLTPYTNRIHALALHPLAALLLTAGYLVVIVRALAAGPDGAAAGAGAPPPARAA